MNPLDEVGRIKNKNRRNNQLVVIMNIQFNKCPVPVFYYQYFTKNSGIGQLAAQNSHQHPQGK